MYWAQSCFVVSTKVIIIMVKYILDHIGPPVWVNYGQVHCIMV
jgi:hypothetical protein